jgi:hypothetical protein
MAIVLRATYDGEQAIEIEHLKWKSGVGWAKKTDYVYTFPLGNWNELKFGEADRVLYTDFLRVMTFRNLEVWRKLAKLVLEEYQDEEPSYKAAAINSLEILDPTFVAPKVNINCKWQCEMLDHLINATSLHVVSTCRNTRRLKKYFYEMQEQLRG